MITPRTVTAGLAFAAAVVVFGGLAGVADANSTRDMTGTRVQASPSGTASAGSSPDPSSAEPSPVRPSPSPSRCGTVVCPTLTPGPRPSRTPRPSTAPSAEVPSDPPSESPSPRPPRSTAPDPLATPEERESTAPEPVLPTVSVSPVQVVRPSFERGAPAEDPDATEAQRSDGGGPNIVAWVTIGVAAAVALGGAGSLGLYLTRDGGRP
ncbi:MAG TPA: hypothetical protein VNB94_13845 [Mycobacteriales bacterium]|nr:hypothetical protein [Mycobacteriales bacterium]